MTIIHSEVVANGASDFVVDRIDLGSINPNGRLVLLTTVDVLVMSFPFANPAFLPASGRRAQAVGPLSANAIASGILAKFAFRNRDDEEVLRGTVGLTGADMNLPYLEFVIGDSITFSTLFYRPFQGP